MTTRSLALCSLVSLLLVGCTLIPAGPGNVVDSLSVTLKVEYRAQKAQADLGERVRFSVELRNLTTRPRELTLRGRPAHDVVVFREDGAEVWRWSHNRTIQDSSKTITLQWQIISFRAEWDQLDNDGKPVSPGVYYVQGLLHVSPSRTLKTQKVELLIWYGPPLELRLELPARFPWEDAPTDSWRLGQKLPLKLKLKNITHQAVELTLLGRPAYDFVITKDWPEGREVWRWSLGKAIEKIAEPKTLAPREELEFTVEWDQRDSTGRLIEPGRYCVQGLLKVEPQAQPVDHYRRYACLSLVPELPLRLSLEAPAQVRAGESVSLKLKIQNTSDCPLTLIHYGPDFIVTTLDGAVVWCWLSGYYRSFSLRPHPPPDYYLTLQPGEVREYEATWAQWDNEDYPALPGTYWVYGVFSASQDSSTSQTVQSAPQKLVINP